MWKERRKKKGGRKEGEEEERGAKVHDEDRENKYPPNEGGNWRTRFEGASTATITSRRRSSDTFVPR